MNIILIVTKVFAIR